MKLLQKNVKNKLENLDNNINIEYWEYLASQILLLMTKIRLNAICVEMRTKKSKIANSKTEIDNVLRSYKFELEKDSNPSQQNPINDEISAQIRAKSIIIMVII